jgi:hypothetical protein
VKHILRRERLPFVATSIVVLLLGGAAVGTSASATSTTKTIPFSDSRLIVEINATDGDAGLQLFVDGEAWRRFELFKPNGTRVIAVSTQGSLRNYGLTELFSESSEPPFTEFPLSRFKELFPAGKYRFRGVTVEGERLVGDARLSHAFPNGPRILTPTEDDTVNRDRFVVQWRPGPNPKSVHIAGYQVLVVSEDGDHEFSVELPASAREVEVPQAFLRPRTDYKVEVLTIDRSGNQTLTETPFSTE